jgi:hypothetical protein
VSDANSRTRVVSTTSANISRHSKVETTPPVQSIGEKAVDIATKQTDTDATVIPTTKFV